MIVSIVPQKPRKGLVSTGVPAELDEATPTLDV